MTTETKTIDIHFIDLSPVDENNELMRANNSDDIGVRFDISYEEYKAIREVQKALVTEQKKNDTPFRYRHVCVQWEVRDTPNLVMNGLEFCPRDSELVIFAYGVELNLFHYGNQACRINADITTYLRDLFPETKQIKQWDELADELRDYIVKEVSVRIEGDFAGIYPCMRNPELEEGCNLKELQRFRYLTFQYEEAPADEDVYMYALELIPDYRTCQGNMVLRVSEVDEDGQISLHNTLYPVEGIETRRRNNGDIELRIFTYDSEREGGEYGLVR